VTAPAEPTLIVASYGDYDAFLGPWLESALQTGHTKFIVLTDGAHETPTRQILRFLGPTTQSAVVESDPQYAAMVADPAMRPLAYLAAWLRALPLVPVGAPFVACHVDTMLQRHLAAAWLEASIRPFGLAVPGARLGGRWALSTTFLCGQSSPIVRAELTNLLREAVRLTQSPERTRLIAGYGSAIGAAMSVLLSRMDDGGGTIIAQLMPTWCSSVDPQAGVIHFEGRVPDPATPLGARWAALGEAWRERTEAKVA
jgi:hypothetical protein